MEIRAPDPMNQEYTEISIRGKTRRVRIHYINNLPIIVVGKWIKYAKIKDAIWMENSNIENIEGLIEKLKIAQTGADIFSFSQKLPNITPQFNIPVEWSNLAVIPITNYEDWWNNRISQVTRKNVRRAARKDCLIKKIEFNDELISGIVRINNETPIRQGRRYWHYGKSVNQVKEDYSHYLDRSAFLGAFYHNELIGFLRIIFVGNIAGILQLLCLNGHYDKRPANALLAKAVETCVENKMKYLFYGQHTYGNDKKSYLTEFKRRNGFEKLMIPSYSVPLSLKGKIAIRLGVHLGIINLVPAPLKAIAVKARRFILSMNK